MPATTVPGAEFDMTKSACCPTVELALAEAVTGGLPVAVPVTLTLVVMTVPGSADELTKNTILKTAVALSAVGRAVKLLLVQVIAPEPPGDGVMQIQPAGAVMDWNVVFAGVAVVKVVSSVASGHGLVTVTSTLSVWPALTVGG